MLENDSQPLALPMHLTIVEDKTMKVQEIVRAAKQLAQPSEELWSKIKARLVMEVPLTRGYVALVSPEDYAKVSQYKWCAVLDMRKDGTLRNVYAMRGVHKLGGGSVGIKMHRFILGITDPKIEVDHEDHNGLNNRRGNLRAGTKSQNQHNARIRPDNTSGYKGVALKGGRGKDWQAYIFAEGKRRHLGCFDTAIEAAKAYDVEALRLFGEYARLNFPTGG